MDFELSKIGAAITKAFEAQGAPYNRDIIDLLSLKVTADYAAKVKNDRVNVEEIQDSVERVLGDAGYADVAKCYILYRRQREKIRNMSVVYGRLLKLWRWIFLVPVAAAVALLCLNVQNGWIFTVSADNIYARGPYFLLVGAMPFIHLAASVVMTVHKYLHAQFYERRLYIMATLSVSVCAQPRISQRMSGRARP